VAQAHRDFVERTVNRLAEMVPADSPGAALEVARALVALNASYLLDAFTRDPAVEHAAAQRTLWTLWSRTLQVRDHG